MKSGLNEGSSRFVRRLASALLASAAAAGSLAHAWPSERPFIVEPANLPEAARQSGEAMLLHDSSDGRTLLYVEQNQGTRLAIFDVTNPARIKSDGWVLLDVPGPFDFVSPEGTKTEVVRFRQGQGEAVLDLNRASVPTLQAVDRMILQSITMPLNANAIIEASQANASRQPSRADRASEPASPVGISGAPDASQIREQVTKSDTGTTFLLTDSGLYLIRRPVAERDKERREWERHLMYDGG